MGTQRRPELWPHVVWCSFLSDGLISEYGITFDTHIVDGFGVSFGREGETMSLGATVIISPNLARYQPEVQWYRDGRWNPRALETLASVWIRLHGQARSDPRSAHLFWASWYIRPWAMEFYLRCSLMRKASDDDRAAILTLSLSFASLSIRCSSAALQVVSDALEWRQGHADPDTPEQGGRGSLHPAHYHQD